MDEPRGAETRAGARATGFAARQLARARDVVRKDLFSLNAATMAALIPEVNVVMDYSRTVNRTQGEGLAAGISRFLGKRFVAGDTVPAPADTGRRWGCHPR